MTPAHELEARPTAGDASRLVEQALNESVVAVSRFETGLDHFVFDVTTAAGRRVVARLSIGDPARLAGAMFWSRRLRPLGVPLPQLLHVDLAAEHTPFAALILERLPGTDLGHVIDDLSEAELRAIADGVVGAQRRMAALPLGAGFGYVGSEAGPFPHASWLEVLRASLARSRDRITQAGVFAPERVGRIEERLAPHRSYLEGVRPVAFLDDTTTKNVLIDAGRLSGIVDVDVVCYGDPLWTLALTRMALLSGNHPLTYTDIWCDLIGLTAEQRVILDLYTAAFCVDFMSEVGQVFNQETALTADAARVDQLLKIYDDLVQLI